MRACEASGVKPDSERVMPDVPTKLLDATANDKNKAGSEIIITGAAGSNIFAGSGTTSISLTSAFFQLLKIQANYANSARIRNHR